jgi:sulfate adenylyltransferase large subunit
VSAAAATQFSVHDFLRQESAKDLLRFSTAGSVDDGKSTLIGRLLYDTQSVYDDQIRSIEGKGTTGKGQIDFALLTDGLRAEREQGITIDVAYRYFSTPKRKFIIADTPGHEQYTRNMATGASTADAAIVLIDARKGVLVQSRRHAFIASLLRVQHVLVAVNKMDLVAFDEGTFRTIETDFRAVLDEIAAITGNPVHAEFVPVSALGGDNVVHRSVNMPWYHGLSILENLESLPAAEGTRSAPFRMPVQRVIRPDHTFRGFAGQIASGVIRQGDSITVHPAGVQALVKRIVTWDGDLTEATAPLSVTLVLDRELDISRGDLVVRSDAPAVLANRIGASLVWMDHRALDLNRRFLMKHASRTVSATVVSIDHRIDVATLQREQAAQLELNHIGTVTLNLNHPIACDPYALNRSTGAFILIDPATNSTVAAGMIAQGTLRSAETRELEEGYWGPVTAAERAARWGHRGSVVELSGPGDLIDAVERSLFLVGAALARIDAENEELLLHPHLLQLLSSVQTRAGLLSLVCSSRDGTSLRVRAEGDEITIESDEPIRAVAEVHQFLRSTGVFISTERANL